MQLKKIAAAVAALLLAANAPVRQSNAPVRQIALSPDPSIRYGRLANGMRYAILHNRVPNGASALALRFDVGSVNEADDQRGLAHLLEHMAFNGSTHIPEGALVPLLQHQGVAFGADANAYTTPDQTVYSLHLPSTNARTLQTALFVFREVAGELTLADDAIERERGVVAAEARLQQTPEMDSALARMRFLFPDARFPDRLPIGDGDTVAHAPPARVRDFYAQWYRPEHALLIFVGDAATDSVEREIVNAFSGWQVGGAPPRPVDHGAVSRGAALIGYRYQRNTATNLLFASVGPVTADTETAESRFQSRLLMIANNIMTERFSRLASGISPPFQSVWLESSRVYGVGEMERLQVEAPPGGWSRSFAVSEQELRRALTFGFTQSEVERQLVAIRRSIQFDIRAASSRTTEGLMVALLNADRIGHIFTSSRDELTEFDADRSRMTVNAVNSAFREAWRNGPRVFVTSGELPADALGSVQHAFETSRQVPVSAPRDVPTPRFAYGYFGPAGRIVSRTYDPVLQLTKVRFANDVRLNIRHMPDADRLHIRVSVRGGAASDMRHSRGWQQAFQAAFLAGGLAAHDYQALDLMRAGLLLNIGSSTQPDGINLLGEVSEDQLLFQLQLLTAYITAPGFRPGPMAAFRRGVESNYDAGSGSAQSALERQFWGVITSNNPYLASPTREELLGWTSARLRQTILPMLERGSMEIGVVGSAPTDAVIRAVARTFGALPTRALATPTSLDRHVTFAAPHARPIVLYHDGPASQAMAAAYWPLFDDSDDRRNAVANLLADILRQRLFERIREREGASYSPFAGDHLSHFFTGFGFFVAAVDTSPLDAERMLQLIGQEVRSMSEGVSQDELDRARQPRLQRLRIALEDAAAWMEPVSVAQSEPRRARAWLERSARYHAVTIRDIMSAARQHLDSSLAVKILVLPRPANPLAETRDHRDRVQTED